MNSMTVGGMKTALAGLQVEASGWQSPLQMGHLLLHMPRLTSHTHATEKLHCAAADLAWNIHMRCHVIFKASQQELWRTEGPVEKCSSCGQGFVLLCARDTAAGPGHLPCLMKAIDLHGFCHRRGQANAGVWRALGHERMQLLHWSARARP